MRFSPKGIPLSYLALAALILPLLTTHLCYLISANFNQVPWCVPYWDSCTSISATGRQLPAKLIFKSGMTATAFISMLLWWCAGQWCHLSGIEGSDRSRRAMQVLGILAALFLVQYTMALGEVGDAYKVLRRTGVVLTFAFTFIAQLLLTRFVGEMVHRQNKRNLLKWQRAMLILLVVLLSTAMVSLILEAAFAGSYGSLDNAFEWVMALMLNLYFALLAVVWHKERMELKIGSLSSHQ